MTRPSAVLVAALLLSPSLGHAGYMADMMNYQKGGLRMGKLSMSPYAAISEAYDSNIYLVPRDQAGGVIVGGGVVSSWITDISAGLGLGFEANKMHKLTANYGIQGLIYEKQPEANNAANQTAGLMYQYTGPQGLTGKVFDNFMNTQDPAFSELVQREQRWQNTLGAEGEYGLPGGRAFGGLSYGHTTHKYVSPTIGADLNRFEDTYGAKLGYKVQPKTRLYGTYRRTVAHFTVQGNARNNNQHFGGAGIEGQIAPKVNGSIETGVSTRHYDQASAGRPGNTLNWNVTSNVAWKPQDRCTITGSLRRSVQESTFQTNRFYISTAFDLKYEHHFPSKVTGWTAFGFTNDKYPDTVTVGGHTAARHDQIYRANVGAEYALKTWLSLMADYEFKERNSVFPGQFNYERHLSKAALKLTF